MMEPFRSHIFVCTQEKPEGITSCSASGSLRVLDAFRQSLQSCGLADEVLLTTCGCLGACDHGPVVIVYPEGAWYAGLRPEDTAEIVRSHIVTGKIVGRLARSDMRELKAEILQHREQCLAAMRAKDAAGMLPENLNELVRGFMSSRVMLTALELDVFTAVNLGARAEEVAAKIHGDPRATEILLNALAGLKLLEKQNGVFHNTPVTARFFVEGSPDDARPGLMHTANLWRRWSTLTECVHAGSSVSRDRDGEFVQAFIAAMDRNARERAQAVVQAVGAAGVRRMLDLGGGSAAYSIAFAKANPELTAEVLDLPDVVPLTREYIRKAGVEGRVSARPGDMLSTPLGTGFDLVLISAICHMFDPGQNRALLRRARHALSPEGRVVVQDFILEPDKTSPTWAALFSVNMLVGTRGGCSYSEPEYAGWLREAGFSEVHRIGLSGPSGLMIGTRPNSIEKIGT
jgi:(2Fe-2S) ferredoxin/SAM-dependent methyltransferase